MRDIIYIPHLDTGAILANLLQYISFCIDVVIIVDYFIN